MSTVEITAVTQAPARARASHVVTRWLKTGDFPQRLIEPRDPDHGFIMEVVLGIARRRRTLEWVTDRYARTRPSPELMGYLLVGLYQLLFMDSVVDYAAVNETVECVKNARMPHSAGFVNGVLRRVVREREEIRRILAIEAIGIRESHPDLLVERWTRRFGLAACLALCRWNNTRPTVTLTPRAEAGGVKEYLARLCREGITEAHAHPADRNRSIELPAGIRVETLPGYQDGLLTVQDPSTFIPVDLLDPQPGDHVLDACAAPGGKTVLIADRVQQRGMVVALDLHKDRIARLQENVLRAKAEQVLVVEGDATSKGIVAGMGRDRFDRIMVDAPCTNTGVLRRRPDARWRFTLARMNSLVGQQGAILENVSAMLKRGGVLVYSTCSLESEEGEGLITAWAAKHPEFTLEETRTSLPPGSRTDGGFAAKLRRR